MNRPHVHQLLHFLNVADFLADVIDWAILYPPHFGVEPERIHANELGLIEVASGWTSLRTQPKRVQVVTLDAVDLLVVLAQEAGALHRLGLDQRGGDHRDEPGGDSPGGLRWHGLTGCGDSRRSGLAAR